MSADEAEPQTTADGPSAGQEGQTADIELGVYKNPELIESVVVFDPIGGANQRFLDTMSVAFYGMNSSIKIQTAATPAWGAGQVRLLGQTFADGNYGGTYETKTVCREISNPGGSAKMDVRSATNPINFRFDGVPMILPRESYFEISLQAIYLGPNIEGFDIDSWSRDDWFKAFGWSRTSSSLIQLVSAVDISATSFQVPDIITQNFLEAVCTKDTEISNREGQVYFNSFITPSGWMSKSTKSRITHIDEVVDIPNYEDLNPDIICGTASGVASGNFTTEDASKQLGMLKTGTIFNFVFRIPLAMVSPVFKVDVLPLFLTNSTNINIQLQVQNPNVGFPFHNPLGGCNDGTTYLDLGTPLVQADLAIKAAGIGSDSEVKVIAPLSGLDSNGNYHGGNGVWTPTLSSNSLFPIPGGIGSGIPWNAQNTVGGLIDADPQEAGATNKQLNKYYSSSVYAKVIQMFTPEIGDEGQLNFMYWLPEFTMKAYIKTYASPYNNPLVQRYLRPYMVGPEGAAQFFRSAFLSYNFNAMTYTVPANSSIPFNFNISQTLVNVPMAFLMFSEISLTSNVRDNTVVPGAQVGYQPTSTTELEGGAEGSSSVYARIPAMHPVIPSDETKYSAFYSTAAFDNTTATAGLESATVPLGTSGGNGFLTSTTANPHASCLVFKPNPIATNSRSSAYKEVKYGLLDVFYRSQFLISHDLKIDHVQVSIGPSGWNLYQRPLDEKAMNEITLNTLTRYDTEMIWRDRLCHPQRFHMGDAFAAFDLSHDMYRGLFIDADNMLNITGMLRNTTANPKTVYIQCILPYMDHFIINLQDSTVTKSQL